MEVSKLSKCVETNENELRKMKDDHELLLVQLASCEQAIRDRCDEMKKQIDKHQNKLLDNLLNASSQRNWTR